MAFDSALTSFLLIKWIPTLAKTTAPVTATIGGKPAAVVYSIASPGFAGLYQVAVTVPAGVTGNVALVITGGAAASNSVTIAVQ